VNGTNPGTEPAAETGTTPPAARLVSATPPGARASHGRRKRAERTSAGRGPAIATITTTTC
jgi:hypothetical protein